MSITHPVTLLLQLARISVGERLRQVDADFVDLLAASMAEQGLMTPIEVSLEDGEGVHALIAGAHRLAAARKLGWDAVEARVFDGDALAAAMREVDENLCRHELSDLDRAAFLAQRKTLWLSLHPEAGQGKKRGKKQAGQIGQLTLRFSEATAEKVGLSERTVNRLIRRHMALHPDVRRRLAGTAFARSGVDLDALAALPHAQQQQVMDLIDQRGITRVSAALHVLRGTPVRRETDEARFLKLVKLWNDSSEAVKARFSAHVRSLRAKQGDAA